MSFHFSADNHSTSELLRDVVYCRKHLRFVVYHIKKHFLLRNYPTMQ